MSKPDRLGNAVMTEAQTLLEVRFSAELARRSIKAGGHVTKHMIRDERNKLYIANLGNPVISLAASRLLENNLAEFRIQRLSNKMIEAVQARRTLIKLIESVLLFIVSRLEKRVSQ